MYKSWFGFKIHGYHQKQVRIANPKFFKLFFLFLRISLLTQYMMGNVCFFMLLTGTELQNELTG